MKTCRKGLHTYSKELRQCPECDKAAKKEYAKTDKNKEYKKSYRKTNEYKEKQRIRQQTPEYKEFQKNYRKSSKGIERRKAHSAKRDYHRNRSYMIKYNITLEDYNIMYLKQEGKCAICKSYHNKLLVDHNHTTSKVRELLCLLCNTVVGFVKEDLNVVAALKEYLIRHK